MFKKVKTSELGGSALDWAVTKCEGFSAYKDPFVFHEIPKYSTDWAQGGPIIEREGFVLAFVSASKSWVCHKRISKQFHGTTPLIAAMRCYVASKLSDKVEIPEELIKC